MIVLDGKKTSGEQEIRLKKLILDSGFKLKLAVILVGDNAASLIYVNKKKEKCLDVGIESEIISLPESASEKEVVEEVEKLNKDDSVTGILVQLPLPKHMNSRSILDKVSLKKDVDGLHSRHLVKILLGDEKIIPCTPKGIISLLDSYGISIEGKKVCVVGFSDVVGKPLATMCINRSATVTVCHAKTKKLKEHTLGSDILMVATGVPKLITEDMVAEGAVIVDIGISKVNGKIVGDVDFENVKSKCSHITPVPGGVGPMTVISLVENMVELKRIYIS
jgi:methylenetetrahydrofolate dehydrogenase (NADP+)/methenyltetrahydrofolate cyclohydrolase